MIDWKNRNEVLAAVDKWPDVFEKEIVWTLSYVAQLMVAATVEEAPVGSGDGGNLATSIVDEAPEATTSGWLVTWGTPVEYGDVVEFGRAPGSRMPPRQEIAAWLWAKRAQLGFPIETEEDAHRWAFVVARSIGRKGFQSGPRKGDAGGTAWRMFEAAVDAMKGDVDTAFNECRDRIGAELTRLGG